MKAGAGRGRHADDRLLELFGRLDPAQQDKLISFAEFLAGAPAAAGGRVALARPARETVTAAIRRLARSYPMLDRRKLMGEASRLMAQHALEGRAAAEVIDELEAAFERHYQRLRDRSRRAEG